ncbi:ArsR/SmtB family transcription factor [Streptomyces sp. NBC_00503]|uniref:ArsR/SmtB family transcription factor n=1 Tax=Streptomyces sp. NBC_00503 TaxID=2903659 RepID=UPI002E811870|nr:winged helix-turn-helix domain-containing protein [Streptomyces sp. NBC_00503]WUD81547.1 winged helix-turn-helix domain-containing protein [Streptomyces sp. NBC_00503]
MPEKNAEAAGPPVPPEPSEPARPSKPAEPEVRLLDAQSLRGLAHPLRIRLLGALRNDGPATASQLAERLGESSGATSYHLRQLAAHGFVEDAPGHGKGRERWWRAAHDGTAFDESLVFDEDPATRGAAEVFLAEIMKIHTQELSNWLGQTHNWSVEWRRGSDLSDFTLQLTAAQSHELILKMHDLVNSYRDLPPEEGMEAVRFHTHAFPRRVSE